MEIDWIWCSRDCYRWETDEVETTRMKCVPMEIDWSDEVETFTDVERTEREWPTEFNSIEIEWTRKTESQDLFGKLKRFKPRDKTLLWK